MSTPVLDSLNRVLTHVTHQIETTKALILSLQNDLPLSEAASTLLRNGNAPKTAILSACQQLVISPPTSTVTASPSGWTATVVYNGVHNYKLTASAPSKAMAEFFAYTDLIRALH